MERIDIDEARNRLDELIARARAGEEVVIMKNGAPAATLAPAGVPDPTHDADVPADVAEKRRSLHAWLAEVARDRPKLPPGAEDSATLIRRMRDEGP